jgi:hypothetical protein
MPSRRLHPDEAGEAHPWAWVATGTATPLPDYGPTGVEKGSAMDELLHEAALRGIDVP